jgi:prophage tail gpP-like protein
MNTQKTKYLKLVVDNTVAGKVKNILAKQKKLIKGKLQLQNERKIIDELLKQYEDHIILLENKIQKYNGGNNVNRRVKKT